MAWKQRISEANHFVRPFWLSKFLDHSYWDVGPEGLRVIIPGSMSKSMFFSVFLWHWVKNSLLTGIWPNTILLLKKFASLYGKFPSSERVYFSDFVELSPNKPWTEPSGLLRPLLSHAPHYSRRDYCIPSNFSALVASCFSSSSSSLFFPALGCCWHRGKKKNTILHLSKKVFLWKCLLMYVVSLITPPSFLLLTFFPPPIYPETPDEKPTFFCSTWPHPYFTYFIGPIPSMSYN